MSNLRRSRAVIQLMVLGVVPVLAVSSVTTGRVAAAARTVSRASMTNGGAQLRRSGSHQKAAVQPSSAARSTAQVRAITLRVDPRRASFGAYTETWGDNLVFDKNHDGNPDVLLSFHAQPWQIWLGKDHEGFTFDRALNPTDRHNCAAADFSGPDGRPDRRADLYCVRGANKGTLQNKRNQLLIQRANGSFVNQVTSWGAIDPSGRGRTVSILHIRGNGRPSLFVGNAESISFPSVDHIFENVGQRFVERRTGGLPSEQNTYCSDTGDFDHDGRQDFLSCSFSLRLYRNLTTRTGAVSYLQVAAREGIPAGAPKDAGLVDLNRDGWTDLVTVSKEALAVRLNRRRSPHFPTIDYRYPLAAGFSFCSGAANGDAAKDLLVVQGLASNTDQFQRPDWMLINSGSGKAFRPLAVPQPPIKNGANGNGDTCSAIPRYRGRRAAWTINNGRPTYEPERHHLGYRQLMILGRR